MSFHTIFTVNSKLFQFSILSTFQNLEFQGKWRKILEKVLLKRRNALLSTKIWKYLFSKTSQGVRNWHNIYSQTMLVRNYWEKREKLRRTWSHKELKTILREHMVKLKIILNTLTSFKPMTIWSINLSFFSLFLSMVVG